MPGQGPTKPVATRHICEWERVRLTITPARTGGAGWHRAESGNDGEELERPPVVWLRIVAALAQHREFCIAERVRRGVAPCDPCVKTIHQIGRRAIVDIP